MKLTEFYVILGHFSPNKLENQNFEKMKKVPGDAIVLHICTKNHNDMMYGSWDKQCNRQNFLSVWDIFCPFTPLTTLKIEKTTWRYYPFTNVYINEDHMRHGFWDRIEFLSVLFFNTLSTHWQLRKSKFWKNEKKAWGYYHFTHVHHK